MEAKIKILIIEDNPGDVRLINIYLKDYSGDNYIFSVADSLSKGLNLLSQDEFDVIILDLTLPDSSGLDTFKRAYEHSPQIPIIVLTGMDSETIGMNAMKLGAQDFLVKGSIKGKVQDLETASPIQYVNVNLPLGKAGFTNDLGLFYIENIDIIILFN